MKFIEPRIHGLIDYFVGIMLIAGPALFNFENAIEVFIPALFGVIQITYALFTRYEFGFFPAISMRKHLRVDLITGALLAASPWIFGFAEYVWQPHVVLGSFQMLMALFTRTYPRRRHQRHHGVRAN
ncbi:MAG TPA: SPW repeat protein [Chitinophagaceae bacterium]|nr:SPW repeat protein [Chitinophagaceae bacterium]